MLQWGKGLCKNYFRFWRERRRARCEAQGRECIPLRSSTDRATKPMARRRPVPAGWGPWARWLCCSSRTDRAGMLARRALPARPIPSSKIGSNFCTDPYGPHRSTSRSTNARAPATSTSRPLASQSAKNRPTISRDHAHCSTGSGAAAKAASHPGNQSAAVPGIDAVMAVESQTRFVLIRTPQRRQNKNPAPPEPALARQTPPINSLTNRSLDFLR